MQIRRGLIACCVFSCAMGSIAFAKPDVKLQLSAFVVQDGKGVHSETPLGDRTIGAGTVVRFVIAARNNGTSSALHLMPSDPIPPHMSYVAGSAKDGSATVEFSIDGKTFSPHPTIKVKTANGLVSKPADPSTYRFIRWVTHVPLPANHTFTYSYEARVNGLTKGAK